MHLFIIIGECLLNYILLEIIDMNSNNNENNANEIKLNFDFQQHMLYCTFSSEGDFILHSEVYTDTYVYKKSFGFIRQN